METEFIYWRHVLPVGIKIEEISGREDKSGTVWRTLAYQIYGENGKDGFRSIENMPSGAPLLEGDESRISVTHTDHLLAVATLPRTPEADLRVFAPRTALGIDAERADRDKAMALRERFLSEEELQIVEPDSVLANIQAWTAKEALCKAALTQGLDWRRDLRIISLPPVLEFPLDPKAPTGEAEIRFPDGTVAPMQLYSYMSDDYLVTVAFSPKCAKFKKTV